MAIAFLRHNFVLATVINYLVVNTLETGNVITILSQLKNNNKVSKSCRSNQILGMLCIFIIYIPRS